MDYAKARKHMVDSQVRPNDVTHTALLRAMDTTPRETFVPSNRQSMAYAEMDIQLFEGRYLLRARDFSKLLEAAGIKDGDLVLDVGCGQGYSSVILAHMAGMVMAVEEDAGTVATAEANIAASGIDNAVVVEGALAAGLEAQGPFDVIVMASGVVGEEPAALLAQLKDGGRLVCIRLEGGVPFAKIYVRSGDNTGSRVVFEAATTARLSAFQPEAVFEF